MNAVPDSNAKALSITVSGLAAEKRKKENAGKPKAKKAAKAKAKRRAAAVEDLDEDCVETPPPDEDDDDEALDPEDLNGSEWNPSQDDDGMSE